MLSFLPHVHPARINSNQVQHIANQTGQMLANREQTKNVNSLGMITQF